MAEQSSAAALLRAQRDLGIALSAETSLDRALALVVETAIRLAGMDCGGIYLADPATGALHLRYHTGLPEEFVRATSHLPPDSRQAQLVRQGQPIYTRYDELIVPLDDLRRSSGITSLAVLPIAHAGQIIGCLNIGSSRQGLFPTEIRHALETLAAQTGSAIARIRAEDALRLSESTSRALLEGVSRATSRLLAIHDLDAAINEALALLGESLEVSRVFIFRTHPHPSSGEMAASLAYEWVRAGLISGLGLPEYQNMDFHALGIEDIYERLSAGEMIDGSDPALRQALVNLPLSDLIPSFLVVPIFAQGEYWGSIGFEHRDLGWHWQEEHRSALRTLANSLGAAIARHQAEVRLRQERDFAELLRDTALALTSTLELDDVLARMLDQVGRIIPYEVANVFLIEGDTAHLVRRQATDPARRDPSAGESRMVLADFPLLRQVVYQQEPCVIADVHQDPDWRFVPGTEYIRSWLAVPIVNRGQVLGLFGLDSTQPDFYGPEHVRLISPIATQAGIALANARLFADIQSLEQIKSQMIRLASHDLRSPLTRVALLVERLLARTDAARDPRNTQDLLRIREATNSMERLVDQVLSLEMIEARRHTLEAVDWYNLTAQAIDALRPELEAKAQQLTLACPDDLPAIQGDPAQLYHAAYNLLHNAIKYTPAGGSIEVRARLQRF
ncbi:MAG: GAF domain-containing protein, partial [Chloroflexota bacterium]